MTLDNFSSMILMKCLIFFQFEAVYLLPVYPELSINNINHQPSATMLGKTVTMSMLCWGCLLLILVFGVHHSTAGPGHYIHDYYKNQLTEEVEYPLISANHMFMNDYYRTAGMRGMWEMEDCLWLHAPPSPWFNCCQWWVWLVSWCGHDHNHHHAPNINRSLVGPKTDELIPH